MKPSARNVGTKADELKPTEANWGESRKDHFGYASDEERLTKRGLEDWELLERIPDSQNNVPSWFVAVIVIVLLVAIGLSFPFWGDRVGYEREWINWGFGAAIVYVIVGAIFVFYMVRMFSETPSQKSNATGGHGDDDATIP